MVLIRGGKALGILSPLNSIDIPVVTITHLNDVDDGESIANPEPGAPPPDDSDANVPRAQIDTGAFASCTDQLHLLHNYGGHSPLTSHVQ
jgi:hypothetical protein